MANHSLPQPTPCAISSTRLSQLESVIERGQQTFIEVGNALLEIRDSRLYREWYPTFEDYCQTRWGWNGSRARQLIGAAETVTTVTVAGMVAPANERQARELVPLHRVDPDALPVVWRELRDTHGDDLTAADVREAVQEHINRGAAWCHYCRKRHGDWRMTGESVGVCGMCGRTSAPDFAAAQSPKMAVHYSSESPEWYTPKHIVERASYALDGIRLDPCSNSSDTPNVPARFHYTVADDGLRQEWHGTVYMNPPYGREIVEWVEKLSSEYEAGRCTAAVALVPARTDTAWFRRLPAEWVCFINGRLTFSEHESAAPFPSVAVYLGDDPERFREAFGDIGGVYRRISDAFAVEAA